MKKVLSQFRLFLVIFTAIVLAVFLCPKSVYSASDDLVIISRLEWKADSDYLLDSERETIWPVQYQRPKKFIIHHTAGSNGGNDPKATIRAIYYYHAQILGWGDIGYNYLIDGEGNIYQGRKGGDGAIGAHAYRDSRCNVIRFGGEDEGFDFNAGTIGIALLGNYEENSPGQKALVALVNLIAHKAVDFGISPKGQSDFQDLEDLPNIIGHQDVDCTLCPGENLEAKLESIRSDVQVKYTRLKDTGASFVPVVKAKLIEQSATELELRTGQTATIWADYKNTGNFTWRRYFEDTVYLVSANYDKNSLLQLSSIGENQVDFEEGNIAPQETGRVSFTIKAPIDQLLATETFYLVYDGEEIPGSRFTVEVEVVGLEYAADLSMDDILPASFVGAKIRTTFRFVNKGVKTWTKENSYLNIYDLNLNPSAYRDSSWVTQDGEIRQVEDSVKNGETATFVFYLKSPSSPGLYKQIFKLFCEGEEIINGRVNFITRVDSHYQAELIEHNIPPAILSIWKPKATIKFKNTGIATWDQNLRLNVYDLSYQPSRFVDNSWPSSSGQFRLKESTVAPGETGTFEFVYRNRQTGIYKQIFRLESTSRNITIQNGNFSLITRVD